MIIKNIITGYANKNLPRSFTSVECAAVNLFAFDSLSLFQSISDFFAFLSQPNAIPNGEEDIDKDVIKLYHGDNLVSQFHYSSFFRILTQLKTSDPFLYKVVNIHSYIHYDEKEIVRVLLERKNDIDEHMSAIIGVKTHTEFDAKQIVVKTDSDIYVFGRNTPIYNIFVTLAALHYADIVVISSNAIMGTADLELRTRMVLYSLAHELRKQLFILELDDRFYIYTALSIIADKIPHEAISGVIFDKNVKVVRYSFDKNGAIGQALSHPFFAHRHSMVHSLLTQSIDRVYEDLGISEIIKNARI
jgi:hypothetical protein